MNGNVAVASDVVANVCNYHKTAFGILRLSTDLQKLYEKKGIMTSRVSSRRIANYNGRGDHRRYELRHGLESGASGATVNGLAGESLVCECLYVRAVRFAICRHTYVERFTRR